MSRARKARLRGPSPTWADAQRQRREAAAQKARRRAWDAIVSTAARLGVGLLAAQEHMRRGLSAVATVRWLRGLLDHHAPGWGMRRVRQRYIVTLPGDQWTSYVDPVTDGHLPGVALCAAVADALYGAVRRRPRQYA